MLNVSDLLPEAVSTDSLTAVAQAGIVGSDGESSITVEERVPAGLPGNEMVEASQASGGFAQSTDGVSVSDSQSQPTEPPQRPSDSLPPSMHTEVIGSKDDGASALVACSHSAILAAPMFYQLVAVANHYGGSYVCASRPLIRTGCNGGHYTAFCRRRGQWYLLNDEHTAQTSIEAVATNAAYCLIYEVSRPLLKYLMLISWCSGVMGLAQQALCRKSSRCLRPTQRSTHFIHLWVGLPLQHRHQILRSSRGRHHPPHRM